MDVIYPIGIYILGSLGQHSGLFVYCDGEKTPECDQLLLVLISHSRSSGLLASDAHQYDE